MASFHSKIVNDALTGILQPENLTENLNCKKAPKTLCLRHFPVFLEESEHLLN